MQGLENKKDIRLLDLDEISQYLVSIGEKAFRAKQIYEWIWAKSAKDFDAMTNLSLELRERYPQIPWSDIIGMRDKLIHDYFGVDLDKVWLTGVEDLPVFYEEVKRILSDLNA